MKRRIGGAGGGSDPAPKKGGTVVAAAVLAGSMAVAGGGAGGSMGSVASSPAASSQAGRALQVRKTEGKKATRTGNSEEAWRRMGMRELKKSTDGPVDCVLRSFGEVREFFLRSPCRSLERMAFGVADEHGNVAAVSVVWVTMPTGGQAGQFQRLIDRHGTGDVAPLGGPLLASYDIHFTGYNYDSRRRGKTVTVAETETASGHVDAATLDAIAEVAALLPPASGPNRKPR